MKKIIIISDTHMPKRAKSVPSTLKKELENGVDLIIHAGDLQTQHVLDEFACYANVEAVCGNVDEEQLQTKLPLKRIIKVEDVTIGITHGHGIKKTTEKRVLDYFIDDEIDLIVYGHSHIPVHKEVNDTVLFNPGSATDKRRQSHYSFGVLYIEGNDYTLKHIYYDSKE